MINSAHRGSRLAPSGMHTPLHCYCVALPPHAMLAHGLSGQTCLLSCAGTCFHMLQLLLDKMLAQCNTCTLCCRSISADTFYVAYSTAHQVVGVMAWPLDGDPNKSLALIAHPGKVVGMNLSHDGCKLVTAGADDGSIMIWQVLSPPQTLTITIATCTVIVLFTLSVTAPLHISSLAGSKRQKELLTGTFACWRFHQARYQSGCGSCR